MPAIDLARLRKQTSRLADFFFVPDEFLKYLREVLESYVNHSLRGKARVAPGSSLGTYRTPAQVLRQIENQLHSVAEDNPAEALDLADLLWEQGTLETSLLAIFLLSRLPADQVLLLARVTAWAEQNRDPAVRAALLTSGTSRMRREAPVQFLALVREWLHPERERSWSNGLQALVPLIVDTNFENLPPILDLVEPILRNPQARLQLDIQAVILALHKASASETSYFLKEIVSTADDPLVAVTFRRILPSLPPALQSELKALLKAGRPA